MSTRDDTPLALHQQQHAVQRDGGDDGQEAGAQCQARLAEGERQAQHSRAHHRDEQVAAGLEYAILLLILFLTLSRARTVGV